MDRLGPYLESDAVDADTVTRLRDGVALIERKTTARAERPRHMRRHPPMRQLYLAATGQNRGKTTAALGLLDGFLRRGLDAGS